MMIEKHSGKSKITYNQDSNGCWICTSHKPIKRNNGKCDYFQITIGSRKDGSRKRELMHRYIYNLYYGDIPQGMVVRHECDNTLCINPSHLLIGTQSDNMNDMMIRGRSTKGEKSGASKLTDKQIKEIRDMYGRYTQSELSKMFGVSQRHISNIVREIGR